MLDGSTSSGDVIEKTPNAAGQEVGVMHACGHGIHIASMMDTAQALAMTRNKWHGTVMIIGQPSEETVDGAKALLADGLYERFGTPTLAIALHDTNALAAGAVGVTSGPALAGATSVDVTSRGVGAHGAYPQDSIDPVIMAGDFVVQLQTIGGGPWIRRNSLPRRTRAPRYRVPIPAASSLFLNRRYAPESRP